MMKIWDFSFRNIYKTFRFIYDHSPKWTLLHISASIVLGILPLGLIYLIKLLIDHVTEALNNPSQSSSNDQLFWIILATGLVFFLNTAIGALITYIKEKHIRQIDDLMYEKIQTKASIIDLEYYENPKYHDIIFRAQRESQYRPQQIINGLVQIVQNSISLILAIVMLTYFNYLILIALVVATIPGVLVKLRYNQKHYKLMKSHTVDLRKTHYFNRILTERSFSKELRLFGLARYFKNQFIGFREKFWGKKEKLLRNKTTYEILSHLVAAVAIFGSFAYMTQKAMQGNITVGDLVLFFLVIRRGFTFLKNLLDGFSNLYEQNLFLTNLFEFLSLKNKISTSTHEKVEMEQPLEITLEGVGFTYPGTTREVLENINMHIPAGKAVAVVGDNGSGKTTLTKLITRFYDPDSGNIFINGMNLKNLNTTDIYKNISVLFQDFILYNLSAKENIWFGEIDKPYNSSEITQSAKMADIHHKIQELPRSYQTNLGNLFEDSAELSNGEWQRLAIARAYFRDAGLYILDEPTSSMDPQTEEDIFAKFRELVKGKTAILISHRFTTIQMADYIYVLDQNTIAEQGTHQELLEKNGKYAAMYKAQAKHYV